MNNQKQLFKFFIFIGKFGIPLTVIIFFLSSGKQSKDVFFLIFMSLHCIARVWETFYTTKEKKVDQYEGDWTLVVATILYIFICFGITVEFNLYTKHLNFSSLAIGIALYVFALILRWTGVKTLGRQWAVHAIGVQKISKVRLIKLGIYKYIRHPIYLGIICELLAIPIICNTPLFLLFVCFFNIPLQLIRLTLEEKNNIIKLGPEYEKYMEEVSCLLPLKYIKKKLLQNV